MDNKIKKLLYRSFDEDLNPEEKKILKKALAKSWEKMISFCLLIINTLTTLLALFFPPPIKAGNISIKPL